MHSKIDFDWFFESVLITKKNNPEAHIIVAGDESYEHLCRCQNITFFLIDEITSSFSQFLDFSNSYRHFSVNPKSYEIFCFARWFILSALVNRLSLARVAYVDSDNVFLSSVDDLLEPYLDNDLITHVDCMSAWFVSISNTTLDSYTEFLSAFYMLSEHDLYESVSYLCERYGTYAIGKERGLGDKFPHFSDMYSLKAFQELEEIMNDQTAPESLRIISRTSPISHKTIPAFATPPKLQYNNFNAYTIYDYSVRRNVVTDRLQLYFQQGDRPKWHTFGNEAPETGWYDINNLHMQGDNKWYIRQIGKEPRVQETNISNEQTFIDFLTS